MERQPIQSPSLPFAADEVLIYLDTGVRDLETIETISRIIAAHDGYISFDEVEGERSLDGDEQAGFLRAQFPPTDGQVAYDRIGTIADQLRDSKVAAVVQPNWLVGGAGAPPTGGNGAGPGARPLPASYEPLPLDEAMVGPLRDAAAGGGPIRLVIMDAWNGDRVETAGNLPSDPLLRILNDCCWDEGPPLIARQLPPNKGRNAQDDDPFPMPDHGPFVAYLAIKVIGEERVGLYKTVLECAGMAVPPNVVPVTIEGWRVLDENGVGDSARLIYALTELANSIQPGERVVLNLSLVTTIPDIPLRLLQSGVHYPDWPENPPERFVSGLPTNNPPDAERLDWMLYQAIKQLADKGVLLVAAAGNASAGEDERRMASYPAAYEEVCAVTAAAYDGSHEAWYANCADGVGGVALYGGDVDDEQMIRPEQSVVGPFTNSTVPILGAGLDPANVTGAVAWAGTSFATPLASGLACLIWAGNPDASAQEVWERVLALADGTIGGHVPVPYIRLLKYDTASAS